MDIRLALMAGTDIPIPECQLVIHQPSIKEIAYVGEEDFFLGVQTLCLNKTMFIEDKNDLDRTTNFQIFMTVMNDKSTVDKKNAVKQIFTLLLPTYKVIFTPRTMILQNEQNNVTIDEDNFEFLTSVLREVFCEKSSPMDQHSFNPANAKAKEIADKLMRGRQRVAEINGTARMSIFTQYLSCLTIGLKSMSLQSLINCTMFQLYDLIERFSLFTSWDLDIRVRLAGGSTDSQPENWMKNIH